MHVGLCMYMHKFVHVHALFNFALLREFYGVSIIFYIRRNVVLLIIFSQVRKEFWNFPPCRWLPPPPPPPRWWQGQLPDPPSPTKSAPSQSILARFWRVKWQNLSTAPGERVDHLINVVVVPARPRNRSQIVPYFTFISHSHTKAGPLKSILARFGPFKWQNPSEESKRRVEHRIIAVVLLSPRRNRPQNELYFDFRFSSFASLWAKFPPRKSILVNFFTVKSVKLIYKQGEWNLIHTRKRLK